MSHSDGRCCARTVNAQSARAIALIVHTPCLPTLGGMVAEVADYSTVCASCFHASQARNGTMNARLLLLTPAVLAVVAPSGVEQTAQGSRPAAALVESFDGLGVGFEGPQGTASLRNPSDNSVAVGPDHVVQTVNSRMAIFTKKG